MPVVLLLLVACAACGERQKPPDEKPADAARPQPIPSPEDEPELPQAPSIADLVIPDGVPALSRLDVEQARVDRSQILNRRALELHNRGEYGAAIALYKDALALDPGHVLARYNLSCAYNLNGQPDEGLAVLKQFYDAGCDECRERLVRASEDAEWHARWNDPRFIELVAVKAEGPTERRWWLSAQPCPDGTELRGSAPPEGAEIYCARPSGRRHGTATAWKDGHLADQGNYDRGRRDGVWLVFDDAGSLRESGEYRRGRRQGAWSEWTPTGEQLADGRYKGGKKHGTWTYFAPDGAIERTETWRNGRKKPGD